MKFYARFLSLLLAGALALSLTSCTGGDDTGDVSPSPSVSADSILPDDFVPDTSVEDLCLATAGIPGDFELLTINGVPVKARSYLYWLASFMSYSSATDTFKDDALDTALLYALVAAKAQELGFDLTEEQTEELESNLALTALMMGGDEAYADALRQMGLDADTFYQMNAAAYYYEQLMNGLYADRPTSEEMDTYIEENDILYAKHILLLTVTDPTTLEPLDDAAIAEKKATAEDLLAQLQGSDDLLTDFDALMNEYSEDSGLASYPDGYTFTAGQMDESFEAATRELEYGQISGLVESVYGYHIILRLDPDTEDTREQYRAELLDAQLQEWLDEADVVLTDEYQALDAELFYAKFTAYQDAFAAEEEEAAADDATDGDTTDGNATDGASDTQGN